MVAVTRPDSACLAVSQVPCVGYDGTRWAAAVRCGACAPCLRVWSAGVARRVRAGMELHSGPWQFVTLTFRSGTCSRKAQASFRRWRHDTFQRHEYPWFRVFEFTKAGTLHVHLILPREAGLPLVSAPRRSGESLRGWRRRLSPAGRRFSDRLVRYGFGPICEVAPVQNVGYAGRYLSKYLSKGKRDQQHGLAEATRIRLYGCSRNWAPSSPDGAPLVRQVGRFIPHGHSGVDCPAPCSPYRGTIAWERHHDGSAHDFWAALGRHVPDTVASAARTWVDRLRAPPVTKHVCECGCGTPYHRSLSGEVADRRRAFLWSRLHVAARLHLGNVGPITLKGWDYLLKLKGI